MARRLVGRRCEARTRTPQAARKWGRVARYLRARLLRVLAATLLIALLFLLAAGCGDDVAPDSVPPQTIENLTASAIDDSSAVLTWTAPGDDGERGMATTYDLRLTTGAVPAAWDTVAVAPGEPPEPAKGGTEQTHPIHGLEVDTVYRFALRTSDENENWSGFSNVATVVTGDPEPPARITDLRAARLEPRAVTLVWTAPTDDGDLGYAAEYALRRSSTLITEETWDFAETIPVWFSPRSAGRAESLRVAGLEVEGTYHFAIRSRDFGGRWSEVSNDLEVALPEDTVPPGAITTLDVTQMGVFTATLRWTAPGNDGDEGRATGYRVRHAPGPIDTEEAWAQAVAVETEILPGSPGAIETLELTGLPGGVELWFAVRAEDEAGNVGELSNPASGFVRRVPRVWSILVDGSGDAATIQAGIDSAAAGDTVLVYPGTYLENLEFRGRDIVLASSEGWESTTIDGSAAPLPVIRVTRGEGSACVIRGFTITQGTGPYLGSVAAGGGIRCLNSMPTIEFNHIRANSAHIGGGVFVSNGAGDDANTARMSIRFNRIEGNSASLNGGGIEIQGGYVQVENNMFCGNSTDRGDGGGLSVRLSRGETVVSKNVFIENVAQDKGGGLYLYTWPNASIFVSNCTIVKNSAVGVGGSDVGAGGGIYVAQCRGLVEHNTVVANSGVGESTCGGGGIAVAASLFQLPFLLQLNIVVDNIGCGLACERAYTASIGSNLYWSNDPSDTGTAGRECDSLVVGASLFANPLFCSPESGDFRVQFDSPAIIGDVYYGAHPIPGCGIVDSTKHD